jgi:sporulation protein YlmC with PRC-barrel domain
MESGKDVVKVKASEYAMLTDLSLNTVKNRIRAGVLKGGKEEDGIWYVYLTQEELDHLRNLKEAQEEKDKKLQSNLEGLKSTLEGSLIATYMSALMQK